MKINRMAPLLALLLIAACSDGRRVERSLTDVHATLSSLPADADAMSLATTFPGTGYYLEPDGGRLVWHFTHQGKDYGRFVATLSEDGPGATTVSTHFEDASDADAATNLDFLRKVARSVGEASIAAALEGRAVDRPALQQRITEWVKADPMAAHSAAIATVGAEMDRIVQAQESAVDEPAYPKPGVYPKPGGKGGPRDESRSGSVTWAN